MTQQDRVLWLLRRGWVCGSTFCYEEGMPRYGARISELRQAGYMIERRHCEDPHHHHRHGQFYQWRLAAEPVKGGQVTAVFEGVGV